MFYRDKTCVVTGGTGFVGGHITRHLLQQGARVRVIAHQRAGDWRLKMSRWCKPI